jgi:hypothetical protein
MGKEGRSPKSSSLEKPRNFNLIQLCKTGLDYDENLLLVAMHFWEGSTNTMQLKCGMLTPTLFDIASITGLPPTCEIYDPNLESATQFNFDTATYGAYMNEHFDKDTAEVYDEECIDFLTFWLCCYVFCTSSLQIAKKFVVMVIQIHEGHMLSKLIMGNLYEAIETGCQTMRTLAEGKALFFLVLGGYYNLSSSI